MITEIHVIVLLRYHETHYIATSLYSSHFKSYSLIACSMLVTYTTQRVPHQLVYVHTCADNERGVTLMIHTIKRFTQLK